MDRNAFGLPKMKQIKPKEGRAHTPKRSPMQAPIANPEAANAQRAALTAAQLTQQS